MTVPSEETLIRYFRDRLRTSIRVKSNRCNCKLNNWEEGIKIAINTEAKVTYQHLAFLNDINSRCARGH